MKCRFSATSYVLFLQASQRFLHITVHSGNALFVNVVAGVFTLSFMPRIVLTKLKTTT